MKTQKNSRMSMIIIMAFISLFYTTGIVAQATKLYGGKVNINATTGADNTLGIYLAGEAGMGILSGPTITNNKPVWFLGGYVGPSIAISDAGLRANLAGGYEQNLTYQRGQYALLVGLSAESWSLEGIKLWPTIPLYRTKYSNFVLSGSWYPNASTVGIGLFYQKEYDCSYAGIKLSMRISNTTGGGRSGSTFNCWGY